MLTYGPFSPVLLQQVSNLMNSVQHSSDGFHYTSVTALVGGFIVNMGGPRVEQLTPHALKAGGSYVSISQCSACMDTEQKM